MLTTILASRLKMQPVRGDTPGKIGALPFPANGKIIAINEPRRHGIGRAAAMETTLKLYPLAICALLAACGTLDHGAGGNAAFTRATHVQLPLLSAWADGKPVRYITTDASTRAAAQKMQANFVPQLANAIPPEPRQPGQPSTLARVYEISNFKQNNVFSSVPQPTGFANHNTDYSPLWRVHLVHWQTGKAPRLLDSEEAILAAEEKQEVRLERTDIVVNCPVLFSVPGGTLPGATLQTAP